MTLEIKEITKSNSYCTNKNCQLSNPETLNRLHKESKLTWKQLANIFKTSERTIRRHARQSAKESQKIKQKRGRKLKIDGSLLDWLRECIIAFNKIKPTTQSYLAKLFDCSQSTICTSLKRARVVYKGFTYQSIEQLRLKNRAKINYFINITLPYLMAIGANIFFLDETGFRCNMTLKKGYGWIGEANIKQKLGYRGKNHTLMFLAQITNGSSIHWDLIEGGMKTEHLFEYLTKFNPPNNGKKNVLIMDNLKVHKVDKIIELLASKGIEVIFLPSYTPELNPVEKHNHLLKRDVRSEEVRTKEKLLSVIEERVKKLQQEKDLTKYLNNSVKECLTKLNATIPTENNKYFWNTERWNSMCSGSRYLSIIMRTFNLQDAILAR